MSVRTTQSQPVSTVYKSILYGSFAWSLVSSSEGTTVDHRPDGGGAADDVVVIASESSSSRLLLSYCTSSAVKAVELSLKQLLLLHRLPTIFFSGHDDDDGDDAAPAAAPIVADANAAGRMSPKGNADCKDGLGPYDHKYCHSLGSARLLSFRL